MKIKIDTNAQTIKINEPTFTIDDVIQAVGIPTKYFGVLLSKANADNQTKSDIKNQLHNVIEFMFDENGFEEFKGE